MKRSILAIIVILAVVSVLYARTGSFDCIRLDDHSYTFRCFFVHDGFSVSNVFEAFTNFTYSAVWMPVTYISYMLGISLFGKGMAQHHLINVAIHCVNAILLYHLLAMLVARLKGSRSTVAQVNIREKYTTFLLVVLSLIWALHPQRVEAVAWIASRKELLCAFFTFLGMIFWISSLKFRHMLTALCCLLACMSKPTGMCFPFLLIAISFLADNFSSQAETVPGQAETAPRQMGTDPVFSGTAPQVERGMSPKIWGLSPAIWFMPAVSVGTGLLAIYSQTHPAGMEVRDLFQASFGWRILNASASLGLYIYHFFIPSDIYLDYRSVPGRFPIEGVTGLVTLLVTSILLAISLRKRWLRAQTLFGCLLFLLASLAPTLGIFGSFGEHARADRFFYIPSVAIVILLLKLIFNGQSPRKCGQTDGDRPRKLMAAVVGCGAVVGCIIASNPVIDSYKNDYEVFKRTLRYDKDNGRALHHVGVDECAMFGRLDRGIDYLRKAQAVRPRDESAAQLAYALALRGEERDYREIRMLCAKFICDHSLDKTGIALEAAGMMFARRRKWREAVMCLEDAIKAPNRYFPTADAELLLTKCKSQIDAVENVRIKADDEIGADKNVRMKVNAGIKADENEGRRAKGNGK